jgi:hypothetical protein
MQPFHGKYPPQDEITCLERPGADVAAVVPPQRLLVPRCSERGLAMSLLLQHELLPPHGILAYLVKCQNPRGAMLDLVGENSFSSVDEEEWSLARRLGRGGADGP